MKKQPEVIESWENGITAPTYVQLETLAYRVYKRPLALFFFPEVPDEPGPRESFRTLPDTEIAELAADTRYKVREARASQIALAELTGGQNPASRLILKDLTVSPRRSPAAVAGETREYLKIELDTQKHWSNTETALKTWRTELENAGVFVFKDSFKQKDVSGFSLYSEDFPVIVINNSTAPTRQIFTLFHELAHLLVHVSGMTKADDSYIAELGDKERKIEVFCNRVAAELLVPTADLRNELSRFDTDDAGVASLARLYKVSREVILRRFLDLRLVTRQRYSEKAEEWTKAYQESTEARKEGGNYYATHASYLSERYARLAFSNYYRGSISVDQLASYLNISVKSVPGVEQCVLQKPAS